MAEEEIREPSYNKPVIRNMVEQANGQTIFNDWSDPNRNRDPYAPSRDIVYLMKPMMMQLLNDLLDENLSPTSNEVIGKSGFTNHRLLEAFNALVDSINSFVGKNRSHIDQTIDEAFTENGYAQLPAQLKLIIESNLGRLFLSAHFFGSRSLTPVGGAPLGDIGYNGTFDFIANEAKQAIDGVETEYARKRKEARRSSQKGA